MKDQILIVDSDLGYMAKLIAFLKANGYGDIIMAINGQVGLQKAKQHEPGLVFTEVLMPVMDGYAFFKELRKDPMTAKTPVVVFSERAKMKETFEALGVEHFIVKPYDEAVLLNIVSRYVQKSVESPAEMAKILQKKKMIVGTEMTNVSQGSSVVTGNVFTFSGIGKTNYSYTPSDTKKMALIFGKNAGVMQNMAGLLKQNRCQPKIIKDEQEFLVGVDVYFPNLILAQINGETNQPIGQIIDSLLMIIQKRLHQSNNSADLAEKREPSIVLYQAPGGDRVMDTRQIDQWIAAGCKKYIGVYRPDLFISRVMIYL